MASRCLIITSVLVVVLGYMLYTPLPEGIDEPWKLRIILANLKIVHAFTFVGEKLGVDSRVNLTRKAFEVLFSFGSRDDRVQATDHSFDGVNVRIYRPKTEVNTVLPGLMYYHGGGWVYLSVDSYDPLTSYIAAEANVAVISVDYRLAPEHPFPVPFDDCVTATVHLLRNAKNYKIDAHRVGIAGDSAGGNFAGAVALKLRDMGLEIQPKMQCLVYPVLQSIDLNSPSRVQNSYLSNLLSSHGFSISRYLGLPIEYAKVIGANRHISSSLRNQYSKYLDYSQLPASFIPAGYKATETPLGGDLGGIPEQAQNLFVQSYVGPLLTPDLKGLPPAYIFTVGVDTLRDDGVLYAKRLENAGVKTKLVHFPGSFHGVLSVGLEFEAQQKGRQALIEFIKENL